MTTNANLAALSAAGVSVWLDDLSRTRITSGNLAELAETRSVVGVTTNPTIFASALTKGTEYDAQIAQIAQRGGDAHEAIRLLTTDDVRSACDVLRPQYDASGGVDGRVSIEVDPTLSGDAAQTSAQALDLWETVDRPNLFIKIPATRESLPSITATIAEGVSVNVTLIFSVQRYREVIDAYLEGLEKAAEDGLDLSKIYSVASFFVSRVDSEIDARLEKIGTPAATALRGKAGLANARLAYAAYQEVFGGGPVEPGDRWQALAAKGAHLQRPLWASTGVKDPAYPDTMYITELVAPHTVNTMPEKTMEAFADHGVVTGNTISSTAAASQHIFAALTEVGIDLDDVFTVLETQGVEKFEASWSELADAITAQLDAARTAD